MKEKKIFTVAMLLFSALYGYGQVSWNVKAGMNVSKITNHEANDMKPGYQFGVGMDYFLNDHWGIQPSLMIISKGLKNNDEIYGGSMEEYIYYPPNAFFNQTINKIYVEMPVMLAYRMNVSHAMKLVLNGGGYISYGIGGKEKFYITFEDGSTTETTTASSFTERMNKFDFGLGCGTALEYKNRYTISLFAEWGIKRPEKSVYHSNIKFSNQTYGLNIGYKF